MRQVKTLEEMVGADRSAASEETGFGLLKTERGGLPLVAMDVRARISGLTANVRVRQTYRNSLSEALEATYIFPLPDRAAVTAFRMEVAGRIVEGDLKERGQAREEYEKAIEAGHRGDRRRGTQRHVQSPRGQHPRERTGRHRVDARRAGRRCRR